MSLVELSLKRPITAIMFYVSMVAIGLIASVRLPLEQFPDVNFPFMMVSIPYPGSTPQEVERSITRPVEETLATLPGIKQMNSTSRADGAEIQIQFSDFDRDVAISANEARSRIDALRKDLPSDMQRYYVQRFSPSDQPFLQIRFASTRDLRHEYEMIERLFKRRIERIPGIANVEITGASPSEIEIAINPSALGAHNIGLNQLAAKLQAINFSVSAGQIDDGVRRLRVRTPAVHNRRIAERAVTQALVGRIRLLVSTLGQWPRRLLRDRVEHVGDARVHAARIECVKPGQDLVAERVAPVAGEDEVDRRARRHALRGESRHRGPRDLRVLGRIARPVGEQHRRHGVRDLRDLRVAVARAIRPGRRRGERVRLGQRRRRHEVSQRRVAHLLAVGVGQRGEVGRLANDVPLVVLERQVADGGATHHQRDGLGALGVGGVVDDDPVGADRLQDVVGRRDDAVVARPSPDNAAVAGRCRVVLP